jgi:hypothetical protein
MRTSRLHRSTGVSGGWFWSLCVLFVVVSVMGVNASFAGAAPVKIDKSFAQRVSVVCAENVKTYPPAPNVPVDGFDPEHPRASDLPAIGRYLTHNQRGIPALESELTRIGNPANDMSAWRRVRGLAFAILRNAQAQRKSALARDAHGFVAAVKQNRELFDQLKVAATRAGIPVIGACAQIF